MSSGNHGLTVFLDRDGTINVDSGYVKSPQEVVLIEGAAEAIKRLNAAGARVFVVSNQSGVARGYFTYDDAIAVNARVEELLSRKGARVDAMYFCPHHPEENCGCRKPAPGMAEKALKEHGRGGGYYVVGDKTTDVELAANIKAKSVMVLTGHGGEDLKKLSIRPDFVAKDLGEAVGWILKDSGTG